LTGRVGETLWGAAAFGFKAAGFDFSSFAPNFFADPHYVVVEYFCSILRPGQAGAFCFAPSVCLQGCPAGSSQLAIPKLNLRRLLCPLSVQRTACPCVRLLSRMAAVAALRASQTSRFCFYPPKRARAARKKLRQRPGLLFSGDYLSASISHRPGAHHPRRCPRRCKTQNAHTVAYLHKL